MTGTESLAARFGMSEPGLWVLVSIATVLAGAAAIRGVTHRRRPDDETSRAWSSIGTWWILFVLLLPVLAVGRAGVAVLTGALSLLLLRETLALVGAPNLWARLAVVWALLYGWALLEWRTLFLRAMPLAILLVVVWGLVSRTVRRRASSERSELEYPILIALIGPSYAVAVASLPPPASLPGSEMGWFLLLVVLTELNDMAQSWWGRAFGTRPLAPVLSPRKTWEGLVGGVATTAVVALLLCPLLTSYGRTHPPGFDLAVPVWLWSLGIAVVIAVAGVTGDLSASALKRRADVKDSGTLLPGHGGALDRFDSIAATAPVFFFVTYLLWFS